MSIEDFLAKTKGPIPNALLQYADIKITVIVQMEAPSLLEHMAQLNSSPEMMQATDQQSYVRGLEAAQKAPKATVEKLGGVVMGSYTKTLNGFMAHVAAKDINKLRALPGVKAVTKAPMHKIDLAASVPLIKADDVWSMTPVGYKGTGIVVAVIDTGIDYTHAMLGGSGDPDDYTNNDPDVVESGTFPTWKVIGGHDFAGTTYNADSSDVNFQPIPMPDDDPLDENGHGTHVASTVAGIDAGFGSGVAPEALLYALKVFGAAGSTNLVVDAIEWAMDPNGDGSTGDHVDVINMSLGSTFGVNDPEDPEMIAVEAASKAGVFVVASAGNSGNVSYIVGAPSVSDSALSVAASTTGFETLPYAAYDSSSKAPYMPSSDNPFTATVTAEVVDVASIGGPVAGELCDLGDIPDNSLNGKIALVQRGTCSFYVKIDNASAKGAVAAIIYNNAAGGDAFISMDTSSSVSGIPAGFMKRTDGLYFKAHNNTNVSMGPDTTVSTFTSQTPADSIASFSSRGPRGYDSKMKPEISAPGVAIFAAMMGSGDKGVSYNGTSMAAPHVAGVAALVKQARRLFTHDQVKAALMNTAVDLADIPGFIPLQGAGRVDAYAAVTTPVVAVGDPKLVSLSWGYLELDDSPFEDTKTVTLYNFSGTSQIYSVTTDFTSDDSGATLTPSVGSVIVPANGSVKVDVTLDLDPSQVRYVYGNANSVPLEEYYGFVKFSGSSGDLRVPFYFTPRPYAELTEDESQTTFEITEGFGYADMTQNGPIESDLWAYPAFMVSDNDPDVADMGDLRYVGMDSDEGGSLIVAAFNMWGPVHDPQPFFVEIDLYIDADQDGIPETVNFNYNLGYFSGTTTNQWFIVQVDLTNYNVDLGSPFFINTDFNSGLQEWIMPASWNYVDDTFDFEVESSDPYGNSDYGGLASFDLSRPPFDWGVTDYNPRNSQVQFGYWVNDIDGYFYSKPLGIMLVDYNGKPGVGQVYYWDVDPRYILNFPVIFR